MMHSAQLVIRRASTPWRKATEDPGRIGIGGSDPVGEDLLFPGPTIFRATHNRHHRNFIGGK
jgi:hypothetical protein